MDRRRSTESSGPRPGRRQRSAAIRTLGVLVVLAGMALVFAPGAFAVGGAFSLLDGRQWEMVSPLDKQGAGIEPLTHAGGVIRAAEKGGAVTYYANGPVVGEPAGNTALENFQVVSTRGVGGVWGTQGIETPHKGAGVVPVGIGSEYKLFSEDLSSAVVEPKGETLLPAPSGSEVQEQTIYLRDGLSNSYQALVNEADVLSGAKLGETFSLQGRIKFDGASQNLQHIVFAAKELLTTQAATPAEEPGEPGVGSLYEWSGVPGELGEIKLASVLPKTEPEPLREVALGTHEIATRDAVSSDGSRVVWSAENGSQEHLYLSDVSTGEAVRLDVPEDAALESSAGAVRFEGANGDGTRIFFTDRVPLVNGAHGSTGNGGGDGDLYVYEAPRGASPLAGTLRDLTLDGSEAEAYVRGSVIGYGGEDLEGPGETYDVYFVDSGVLSSNAGTTGAEAVPGGKNLYVDHFVGSAWQAPRFIATLSNEDAPSWAEILGEGGKGTGENGPAALSHLTSGVSPSGKFLAFMSLEALTGFGNRDASSGVSDEEVFLYDAQTEKLVCASCNSFGIRPHGVLEPEGEFEPALLVDQPKSWGNHWLAGSVPGWDGNINYDEAQYDPRFLSNSGRLFFDSADALVPGDVNGREDVYEYEPAGGTGSSCTPETSGRAVVFREEDGVGGCVGLISSGTSSEESAFLEASGLGRGGEEGEDVFFLTKSQLVTQDTDSAYDVYDAHECSSEVPCTSSVVSVPPACNETESCRAAPAAQPGVFGLPSSATFSGPGNPASPAPAPAVKTKRLTRAQQLTGALKTCRRKPKRKRAGCEAQARRKYGPIHKTKTKHETNTKSGRKK